MEADEVFADEVFMENSILVSLSRRTTFCAGRRLWQRRWDAARNREVYGLDVEPHGHEYELEVAYSGPISAEDGMITNLIDLKPVVENAVSPLRESWLEHGKSGFSEAVPTVENIALFLWHRLPPKLESANLYRVRLRQSRHTRIELTMTTALASPPILKIARSYEFAAAHRLFISSLSQAENLERFDKCTNPAGHGHNYGLDVWVEGTPDPQSGLIIEARQLDALVEEEVYRRFDHKHLNVDCPEFAQAGLVPTSENLARLIFDLLGARLAQCGHRLARIGLRETQKNYFEVDA